jgi:hypothetical protein
MSRERWETDEDLAAARGRFAATVPGYTHPIAYATGRLDGDGLTFGYVNDVESLHRLPAAVLASVCGHHGGTATYRLTQEQFADAVDRLAPAEAATHWTHPNLWSWRDLLEGAGPASTFVVFFLASTGDAPVDDLDRRFRRRLTGGTTMPA